MPFDFDEVNLPKLKIHGTVIAKCYENGSIRIGDDDPYSQSVKFDSIDVVELAKFLKEVYLD